MKRNYIHILMLFLTWLSMSALKISQIVKSGVGFVLVMICSIMPFFTPVRNDSVLSKRVTSATGY